MKKLVLNTGLSYSIRGFSCVKEKPFEVDDGLAEKLLKTGRFTELQAVVAEEMSFMPQSEETEDVPVETENQEEDKEPFEEKMTRLTSELSEMFAKSHELEDEIKKKLGAIGYEI